MICTHSSHFTYNGEAIENRSYVMLQKVFYLPVLFMGCGVVERHLAMACLANKKHTENKVIWNRPLHTDNRVGGQ